MKIVFDNGEANVSKTPMAYACCDKCEKPIMFTLGFINEPLRNNWDKEEQKYCQKCGALLDWDSLDIPKAINNYESKIRADERANVIDEIETKLYEQGFIWTEHAEKVWEDIREQLKEQSNENISN